MIRLLRPVNGVRSGFNTSHRLRPNGCLGRTELPLEERAAHRLDSHPWFGREKCCCIALEERLVKLETKLCRVSESHTLLQQEVEILQDRKGLEVEILQDRREPN